MSEFSPSIYQQAIFDEVIHGVGNVIIDAVAGSGKSTTIQHCVSLLPKWAKVVILAFNKIIADELKERGLPARTLNAIGYSNIMRHGLGGITPSRLDGDKTMNIAKAMLTPLQMKMYGGAINKMIGWAKGMGAVPMGIEQIAKDMNFRVPFIADPDTWLEIFDACEITLEHEDADIYELIHFCDDILAAGILDRTVIDFDDQKYLTVIFNVPCFQNDFVFLDESQDLNDIDRMLVRKVLKRNGRLFAVGDRHQAIYAWRGARTNSMDLIKEDFNCKELPLSVCYRCPVSVVKMAQTWVPHIEWGPNAQEGKIITHKEFRKDLFQPGDLMICRNNAPLVQMAFALMAAMVPVQMAGRDFAKGLINLIEGIRDGYVKQNRSDEQLPYLEAVLSAWREREIQKALAKDNSSRADRIDDMYVTIMVFINSIDGDKIQDVIDSIDRLFTDRTRKDVILLSSIHRAKGGEANRVFILDWYLLPSNYATTEEAQQQERNLQYVAVTRSRDELHFIYSDKWIGENTETKDLAQANG